MTDLFPPAFIFFAAALLLPFIPRSARNLLLLVVPIIAFFLIASLEPSQGWHYRMFGFDLTLQRIDKLSKVFGYVFVINAFFAFMFAKHLKTIDEHLAALVYIGASLGAVFAGDLITLYLFWEVMAISSAFLILAR